MKVPLLVVKLVIIFLYLSSVEATPIVEWVAQSGCAEPDYTRDLCVDGEGNVFSCGLFESTIEFNNGINLTSRGDYDVFFAKYNSDGICLWAKQIGGTEREWNGGICADKNGDIIITGSYNNTAIFGDGIELQNRGVTRDIFLARYDTDGNLIWATSAGSEKDDAASTVCTDLDGNIFVSGYFGGYNTPATADFGNGIRLDNKNSFDVFVAKYSSAGTCLWAKSAGGYDYDLGHDIECDGLGNLYLTGIFTSSATFDDFSINSKGDWDIFICKYNNDGICQWVKRAGGSERDASNSIALNNSGDIFITGQIKSEVDFDDSANLISKGMGDIFIAKFRNDGELLWVKQAGGLSDDSGLGIDIDYEENILVTGAFQETSEFDDGMAVQSNGDADIFIVQYNNEGDCNWLVSYGSDSTDVGRCIFTRDQNSLYILGGFSRTIDFDKDWQLSSHGKRDVFLLKLVNGCDISAFNYPEFNHESIDQLHLMSHATNLNNEIRLTGITNFEKGAIWHKEQVPVRNGFTTDFSFRFSEGKNGLFDDGSIPGADGIAFVIQNYSLDAIGDAGGGLGYDGIRNSLAVEFDTYRNYLASDQINDENGNHVAIMCNGTKPNSASHDLPSSLAVNNNIMDIKPDSTIYHARIDYNIEENTMRVYIDTTVDFSDPVLTLDDLDISGLIDLENGEYAWVGFTSATGNGIENHDLLSWEFCPQPAGGGTSVKELSDLETDNELMIYPNPIIDRTTIRYLVENPGFVSMRLVDIYGNSVALIEQNYTNSGEYILEFSSSQLPSGQYYLIYESGNNIITKIMTIVK